ncbi:MAG: endonuclease domain-containing protein [Caulobacteraceae bacterium]
MKPKVLTLKRARALRREMSLPEVILWDALRQKRVQGLRFRRQQPMGNYILDFYCPGVNLAVEIDGADHGEPDREGHDARRDRWLLAQGVRVLRFPAASVLDEESLEGVLEAIARAAAPSPASRAPSPTPKRGGGSEAGTSARR